MRSCEFWGAFCDVVDRPDWIDRAFDPSLRPELDALFAERSRDEWSYDATIALLRVSSFTGMMH